MSTINQEQILDAISEMSVMQVVELVEAMEEKFGVSAAAAVVAGGGAANEVVEEQTEFTVTLTGAGSNKVAVIKAVRGATGLGLKEAKALVDNAPSPLKEDIAKEEAESLKAQLEEAGATVELK